MAICHYSGYVLYTLIAVVLKDYDAVFLYTIVDIYLLYEGAVGMQILALFTRIQCKVSDTQVIDKACGPLGSFPKLGVHVHSVQQFDYNRVYSGITHNLQLCLPRMTHNL